MNLDSFARALSLMAASSVTRRPAQYAADVEADCAGYRAGGGSEERVQAWIENSHCSTMPLRAYLRWRFQEWQDDLYSGNLV